MGKEGPVVRRNIFLMVKEELTNYTNELDRIQRRAKDLEQRINACQDILSEYKKDVCPSCGGHGSINQIYDQDDIKLEPCERCKGTGLP